MSVRGFSLALGITAIGLVLVSGVRREEALVATSMAEAVAPLEERVAHHPDDPEALRQLVETYLNLGSPGMAVHAMERAPASVRKVPRMLHLYARALVVQGRNGEAIAAEEEVLKACQRAFRIQDLDSCDPALFAAATHRSRLLHELLKRGVEDTERSPDEARAAVRASIRSVSMTPSP